MSCLRCIEENSHFLLVIVFHSFLFVYAQQVNTAGNPFTLSNYSLLVPEFTHKKEKII